MMDLSSSVAYWLVGLGLSGAVVGVVAWLRQAVRPLQVLAAIMGWLCLVLALGAWVLRFRAAEHLPLFGTYESSLSLALACLLMGVFWGRRGGVGNWMKAGLWPALCAVSAGLVAHGLRYDPTIYALTISERSWVVDIHAFMAWLAFGVLTANAGLAVWLLLRPSVSGAGVAFSSMDVGEGLAPSRGRPQGTPLQNDRASGTSVGEGLAPSRSSALAWTLSLGFALHTAMLASGSFYKFLLFGTAWSFDPIETLGFVAWVAYGTLLHMHLFAQWEGLRLVRWCLGLFVILVVSYRGIVYFPAWSTYHIFDMDLRMHLTGGEEIPFGDLP